ATFDPATGTVRVTAEVVNAGTTVAEAHLVLDGETVAGTTARVGGGQTRELSFTLDAADVSYAEHNELAVAGVDGASGEPARAALLPYPDGAALEALVAAARADGD